MPLSPLAAVVLRQATLVPQSTSASTPAATTGGTPAATGEATLAQTGSGPTNTATATHSTAASGATRFDAMMGGHGFFALIVALAVGIVASY